MKSKLNSLFIRRFSNRCVPLLIASMSNPAIDNTNAEGSFCHYQFLQLSI